MQGLMHGVVVKPWRRVCQACPPLRAISCLPPSLSPGGTRSCREFSTSLEEGAPPATAEVVMAQAAPYKLHVHNGQRYSWCTCGQSSKQPLCDGSHKGTGIKPLRMVAEEDATLYL